MKTYAIPIQFQFNGTVEIRAESMQEARMNIMKYISATCYIQNAQINIPFDHRNIIDTDINSSSLVFLPINMDTLNIPF